MGNTSDSQESLVARLRSFAIFDSCPDEFIFQFVAYAKLQSVPKNTVILEQSKTNSRFLVLMDGKVEVRVDGEQVTILETPGDLMGEISAVNGRVITASLQALTDVQFLEINGKDLNPAILGAKTEFGYHFYRLLSSVLSDKIIRTNDKARRFEIANRALVDAMANLKDMNATLDQKVKDRTAALERTTAELASSYNDLEFQNSELLASHRKIEELYSSKDMTFKKLNELYSSLLTLVVQFNKARPNFSEQEKAAFATTEKQLEHAVKLLLPMTQLYSTEQAIRNRRVLVAEPDRKQQAISKMALGGTGVELKVASTAEEVNEILSTGTRFDLAFISSDFADLIPNLRKRMPTAKLVFVGTSNIPGELPKLKAHAGLISNIVTRHPEDRTFTVKNVATTVSKLVSKDIFGLEKYMIWGVEVQERRFTASNQRLPLIQEMQEYFSELGVRSTISDRAALVTEELLMNAIYDAPVDSDGKSLFNHLDRTTKVELDIGQQGLIRYACDGMLAAVSVADPFGGFRMNILLDYLERNHSGRDSLQLAGKGGAGRGLHLITENADLVVFNVKTGVQTEVVALFNLDPKSKIDGLNPSFHFFQE